MAGSIEAFRGGSTEEFFRALVDVNDRTVCSRDPNGCPKETHPRRYHIFGRGQFRFWCIICT